MFNVPIPGESLTRPPKLAAYENPPQVSTPEEAMYYHLDRLSDEYRLDAVMQALEKGLPLQNLVEGIVRSGVAEGIHNIDVSLIVAPVIHEYLKGMADNLGVEYDEGEDFKKPDMETMQQRIGRMSAKMPSVEKTQRPQMAEPQEEQPPMQEAPPQNAGPGLMARPQPTTMSEGM